MQYTDAGALDKVEEEKKEIEQAKNKLALEEGFIKADVFLNRHYLSDFSAAEILPVKVKDSGSLRILKIKTITVNEKESVQDRLISVFNALYSIGSTVALMIIGEKERVNLYYITRSDKMNTVAGNVLVATFRGNFPGVQFEQVGDVECQQILNEFEFSNDIDGKHSKCKALATLSMLPSLKRDDDTEYFAQGMEKFIDAMQGKQYSAIFLASPVSADNIQKRKYQLEELSSALSPFAKRTYTFGDNVSHAVNNGITTSFAQSTNRSVGHTSGSSYTETEGTNTGGSFNYRGWGSSSGSSSSYSSGTTFSESINNSVGNTSSKGMQQSNTDSKGHTESNTISHENKSVINLMKKIDDDLKRLEVCESYGLWESCAYFFSEDISVSVLAATTYKSIMLGKESFVEGVHINIWDSGTKAKASNIQRIMDSVKMMEHPLGMVLKDEVVGMEAVHPTNMISGLELALMIGFPRGSVVGIPVRKIAEFGRNVVYQGKRPLETISFGNIYHMGNEDLWNPVQMDVNLFASHCFISGSSGSGKSYATYNLLDELLKAGKKILVIEPAKGEYKVVFGRYPGMRIFTSNTHTYELLRVNPFKFPKEIHILSHIEKLLQIFNASWPLYAAMPEILKEAVINAYIKKGWDIMNSIHIKGVSEKEYPTFLDVLYGLPEIIDQSNYSAEAKGNYKGALVTRVKAMTSGLAGLIFNDSLGLGDNDIFDNNTIIDLSEIGAGETVSLLMGVLIMRLGEYRFAQRRRGVIESHDSKMRHITVLEEAHNILKRVSKEQSQDGSNIVGKSVEMITDAIKEMRTYGEGFIIIDQSPLAVDGSVIENTATKIIMNTPSREACAEVGSSMALSEEQTSELSKLDIGVASVMQKGWMDPVLMKVRKWDYEKYQGELQNENFELEKRIRGNILATVFEQLDNDKFSLHDLNKVFKKSELTQTRIDVLKNWINNSYAKLQKAEYRNDHKYIGKIIEEFIQCECLVDVIGTINIDTADVLEKKLKEMPPERQIREVIRCQNEMSMWLKRYSNGLSEYIYLNANDKARALYYILCWLEEKKADATFGMIISFILATR